MLRIRSVMTGVAGAPYYSNLYFPTVATSTEAQARAKVVRDFWQNFASILRTPMVINIDPVAPEIDPVSGDITGQFVVNQASVQAFSTNDPLPPATQILVRLPTGVYVGGRQVQGRWFLPGWTEATNDATGRVSSATASDLTAYITTNLCTGPDRLGVWSRKNGTFQQVGGCSVSRDWSVLRSRKN